MEKILLFEDFTKLYKRWNKGEIRKENDYIRKGNDILVVTK